MAGCWSGHDQRVRSAGNSPGRLAPAHVPHSRQRRPSHPGAIGSGSGLRPKGLLGGRENPTMPTDLHHFDCKVQAGHGSGAARDPRQADAQNHARSMHSFGACPECISARPRLGRLFVYFGWRRACACTRRDRAGLLAPAPHRAGPFVPAPSSPPPPHCPTPAPLPDKPPPQGIDGESTGLSMSFNVDERCKAKVDRHNQPVIRIAIHPAPHSHHRPPSHRHASPPTLPSDPFSRACHATQALPVRDPPQPHPSFPRQNGPAAQPRRPCSSLFFRRPAPCRGLRSRVGLGLGSGVLRGAGGGEWLSRT